MVLVLLVLLDIPGTCRLVEVLVRTGNTGGTGTTVVLVLYRSCDTGYCYNTYSSE
jgi:hypothetical protein